MPFDAFAVLKYIWGFVTFLLLGILKHMYSEFQKIKSQVDALEKEMIKLKTETVTKDQLDEILDRKMKPLQDNIQDVKKAVTDVRDEVRDDVTGLRGDVQSLIKTIIEKGK